MPKSSLQNLRESIDAADELTPEHREELRRVIGELETEIHPIMDSSDSGADTGELRQALDLTGELVKQKGSGEEGASPDLLTEFETSVEKVAVNHPVVAGVLTALGKLI